MSDPSKPGRGDVPAVVVWHGERTEEGDVIEPEEQLAEVVQPIKTVVTIGNRAMAQDVDLASLPEAVQRAAQQQQGHIAHQTTASELALSTIHRCTNCIHFDQGGWLKIVKEVNGSGDKVRQGELNSIRGMIAENMNVQLIESSALDQGGDIDLEHALKSLGICRALTEHDHETVIVSPISSCPDDRPFFFQPKSGNAQKKAAHAGYDWILRRAQGRKQ